MLLASSPTWISKDSSTPSFFLSDSAFPFSKLIQPVEHGCTLEPIPPCVTEDNLCNSCIRSSDLNVTLCDATYFLRSAPIFPMRINPGWWTGRRRTKLHFLLRDLSPLYRLKWGVSV
jgi:hypothetical protein